MFSVIVVGRSVYRCMISICKYFVNSNPIYVRFICNFFLLFLHEKVNLAYKSYFIPDWRYQRTYVRVIWRSYLYTHKNLNFLANFISDPPWTPLGSLEDIISWFFDFPRKSSHASSVDIWEKEYTPTSSNPPWESLGPQEVIRA